MKATKLLLASFLVLAAGAMPVTAVPDHAAADKPSASTAPDAGWLAKAKAEYPLKTCVVSEEELGGMGNAIDFVYQQEGQPDRLVRFCCKMCLPKFKKDPAKYLKAIDEAGGQAKKH